MAKSLFEKIWKAIGGPGVVLVSGEVGGLWRPSKKGKRLLITIEPLGKLTTSAKNEIAAEADRIESSSSAVASVASRPR